MEVVTESKHHKKRKRNNDLGLDVKALEEDLNCGVLLVKCTITVTTTSRQTRSITQSRAPTTL